MVSNGQGRSGQVKKAQDRSGHIMSGQSGQVRTCEDMFGQVEAVVGIRERPGQNSTGQYRSPLPQNIVAFTF